jgi:hypothetical protein
MILLSSAKFLNVFFASFSLLHWKPAFGSCNVDVTILGSVKTVIEEVNHSAGIKTLLYVIHILVIFIFSCMLFSLLLSSPGSGFQHNIKATTHY